MTGGDLLASAARLINVLASGETLSGNEISDGLVILNQMLDSWNSERLNIFTIPINEFPLVPGQQVYTLGIGGNFNIPRPPKIERISIVSLLNPAQPLELPLEMLTEAGWQAIPVKLISSSLPTVVYDDQAFPLRNLNFWCIPTIAVNVRIYGWAALNQFDLTTDMTFPPGYLKAIRYALAVDLAPEFGRPVPPEVATQAMMCMAKIKRMNAPMVESQMDPVLSGNKKQIYNWISDTFISRG